MAARRKKVVKIDTSAPALVVKDGVVEQVAQPVIEEIEIDDVQEQDSGKPKWTIHTSNGDAVYEYRGNCVDCEREGVEMELFHCISHPIRADAQLGNQLASYWNEGGGTASKLCMKHYNKRLGRHDETAGSAVYRVLDSNKFDRV